MEDLLQRKEEHKSQGLTLKEKAIKLLMNSGYGTFGQVYFKYYDPRVAELITGFARHTLEALVKFVSDNGGKILFGDTDSIFVAGDNGAIDIISEVKKKFNVKLVQASIPSLLLTQVSEFSKFACFDTEWYRGDLKENIDRGRADEIYAFCLTDSHGNKLKLHIYHYNGDRRSFMSAILDNIERYDLLAGFAIFSDRDFISDIDHIRMNCEKVGLLERFVRIKSKIKFLDLQKVFNNNTVKGFLKAADKIVYREESLDAVAQAYIGQGKPEGVSGINVEFLQPSVQLEYCLKDAQLCYSILQNKDFELLQILYEISQEIKLPFFETCNAGYPTEWWRSKLASIDIFVRGKETMALLDMSKEARTICRNYEGSRCAQNRIQRSGFKAKGESSKNISQQRLRMFW